jgi:uncharacterized protein DUF5907
MIRWFWKLGVALVLVLPVLSWAQTQVINGNRIQAGWINYGLTSGTGTAYTLTLTPPFPGYVDGTCFLFRAHIGNSGDATLNVNAKGAVPLRKWVGGTAVPLVAGDIAAQQDVQVCHDMTNARMQVLSLGGGGGAGVTDGDKTDITVAASGTVWTIDVGAVTYAKLQNTSVPSVLLGRNASSAGPVQEILLGPNLSMSPSGILSAAGTSGVADGDKGDLTITAGGTVWTIDPGVVTYAKIQNVSAPARLLGRFTGGAGPMEELTATQVKTILGLSFGDLTGSPTDAQIPDLNTLSTGLTPSRCVQTDGAGFLSAAVTACGAGSGVSIFGSPTAGQLTGWHSATQIEGVSTLNISFAATAVSTTGAVATGIEYVTTGAGGVTRTLPPAASGTVTRQFTLMKISNDAGILQVAPAGGNTISGPVTAVAQYSGFIIREVSATSWVSTPIGGSGPGIFGSPTAGQLATWHDGVSLEGANTLSIAFAATPVSTAGTIATGVEYVTTGAGGLTRTLPAAVSGTVTRQFTLIKVSNDAGVLTVAAAGGNTISGPVTTTAQWSGFVLRELSATSWLSTPLLVPAPSGVLKGVGGAFATAIAGTDYVSPTGPEDVSNKRMAPRVLQLSAASGTVTAPDATVVGADTYYRYDISGALTIPVPIGTAVDGQRLLFRLKPASTPQTVTFTGGANGFCAVAGMAMPTATGDSTTYVEYAFTYASAIAPNACWLFDGTTKATAPLGMPDGGTGQALTDPGVHSIWVWDETLNQVRQAVIGTGLTYTSGTNTLAATAVGGGTGHIQLWPGMLTLPDGTAGNALAPAQVTQSTGTPPTDAPKLQFTDLLFDPATDQHAFSCFPMPNDYGSGGTLYLNWRRTSGTAAANAEWKAGVAAVTPGGTENLTTKIFNTVTFSGASAAGTTTNASRQSTITLNMDTAAARDTVCIMFGRNADSSTDSMSADPAAVSAVWLEYTKQ